MAKQTINIGTTANDGTGDTIRAAFDKANDNFTELYDQTTADIPHASTYTHIDTAAEAIDAITTVASDELVPNDFSKSVIFGSSESPVESETAIQLSESIANSVAGNYIKVYYLNENPPNIDYGAFQLSKAVIGSPSGTTPATLDEIVFWHDGNGFITQTYIQESGLQTAAQTSYDNTESELTATDVQAAIDEVAAAIDALTTPPSATQTGGMGMFIETLADQDYIFAIKMPFSGTITETTTKAASGTATATFKINTTALGGTANAISSAEESQAHASANAFAAGDDIICTISANSTCLKASLNIKFTYTLA